jgi:AcrR family transcriptional regulator
MKSKKEKIARLDRIKWLALAMDTFAKEGRARLRIEELCRKMGVTRGSFYWHFHNRDDFVKSLVKYWMDWSTQNAIEVVNGTKGSARARLQALAEYITEKDLGKYDMIMRSWALHEPQVAKMVQKVDEQRLAYIRSLFKEMGFVGDELEMRAQTFAGYHSLERGFLARAGKKGRKKYLKQRLALFTRP